MGEFDKNSAEVEQQASDSSQTHARQLEPAYSVIKVVLLSTQAEPLG